MKPIYFKYIFSFGPDWEKKQVFDIKIDAKSLELLNPPTITLPSWTLLEFYQCTICPLKSTDHPYCPVAVNLVTVVQGMGSLISYDQVQVEVQTRERTITGKTTVQQAIRSLIGLLMAVSGCPHTAYFKPMARFHLPLSSEAETIYRASSMYLLAQYFKKKDGKTIDLDFKGLKKIYQDIQLVNYTMAARLREASKNDSILNAIVELDIYAQTLTFVIEDSLKEFRSLFSPYLK